ncbi:hypothetical protein [Streptomyces sp. SID13726]|uniref:hypothetical protein n=1 Tax=Streptomyces sp. SID13726 TaxID=2706058 RepID=UPI0013DAF782|nr:hypothetical protein [Streptomyces sp. SID13726]
MTRLDHRTGSPRAGRKTRAPEQPLDTAVADDLTSGSPATGIPCCLPRRHGTWLPRPEEPRERIENNQ